MVTLAQVLIEAERRGLIGEEVKKAVHLVVINPAAIEIDVLLVNLIMGVLRESNADAHYLSRPDSVALQILSAVAVNRSLSLS